MMEDESAVCCDTTWGCRHDVDSGSGSRETALPTQVVMSDAQRASGSCDGVTIGRWTLSLLSGESVSLCIDDLAPGITAEGISARLEVDRPLEEQQEYRVLAGAHLLEDDDVVFNESFQNVSIVVTERRKTTIMIKNLPFRFSPMQISKWLNDHGKKGLYDLINVCLDFKKLDFARGQNFGYCFVNFRSEAHAQSCVSDLSNDQLGSQRGGTRIAFAQRHGTLPYQRTTREMLANAKPHEQLGLRLGLIPFTADGSVVQLEEWLGVATFPSAVELLNHVGHTNYAEAAEVQNHKVFAQEGFQAQLLKMGFALLGPLGSPVY